MIRKLITTMVLTSVFASSVISLNQNSVHADKYPQEQDHGINWNHVSDGPWETNSANQDMTQYVHHGNQIYYSVHVPKSINQKDRLHDYRMIQQAIANWNSLGVIKLVQVPWGNKKAQIRIADESMANPNIDADANANGNTISYLDNNNDASHYLYSDISIYAPTFEYFNAENQVGIVEHEIGHALGFDHDNRKFILPNEPSSAYYLLPMNQLPRTKVPGLQLNIM